MGCLLEGPFRQGGDGSHPVGSGRERLSPGRRHQPTLRSSIVALVSICPLMSTLSAANGQVGGPKKAPSQIAHVAQTLEVPTPGAAPRRVNITIDDWRLDTGETVMIAPAGGPTVVEVNEGAGSARLPTGDKAFEPGDYWSVPAGTQVTVSIRPPARGAILRTITLIAGG